MPHKTSKNQKLVAVFLLGFAFFNYPLLQIFNKPTTVFGIPVLYVYIFLVWLILILLTINIIESFKSKPQNQLGNKG